MGCLKLTYNLESDPSPFLCFCKYAELEKTGTQEFFALGEKKVQPSCDVDYYPFGLSFNSYSKPGTIGQSFKYNGKELVDDLDLGWYDYGARMYMPELGRWGVVDKLADDIMQIDKTPYQYAWNSPVNLTDPDGNCPWCVGALVGFAVEVGSQMVVNAATGKDLTDIDWVDVGAATVVGAATAGIGALATAGKVSATVAKVATTAAVTTGEVVQAGADGKFENGDFVNKNVVNGGKDKTDAAVELAVGKTAGAASKQVSKAAGNMLNSSANKTLKQASKTAKQTATGSANNKAANNVVAATEATINGNQKVVDKAVSTGVSAGTSQVKEKAKDVVNDAQKKVGL